MRTFLLEKSRVTNASLKRERSANLLPGAGRLAAGGQGLPLLLGKTPEDYHYTSLSGTHTVDAINDVRDFAEMDSALESCGLRRRRCSSTASSPRCSTWAT